MNTIEQLRGEIRDIEAERNNAFRENSHLQADLYAVSQEAEKLRRALEASKAEAEELKGKLKIYCSEVKRIEDDLVVKESEREDLLEHLRFLSQESSELGTNQLCLTKELETCKLKLTEAEKDIMRLEACIEENECTIKSLEGKLQELACIATQLEEQLQSTQQENFCQSKELSECRETVQELLMQKEALCRQLTTCENCKVKIEGELQERKGIICTLEAELAKERDHSGNLEEILRQTKIGMHEMCLCNQRYEEEILGLGEKISFLCAKLNEEKQENKEFHFNIETLRKQVMDARHEKSHIMKEDLKQSQRHNCKVAVTNFGNPVDLSGLSNPRDFLNDNRDNKRYFATNRESSIRRTSYSYRAKSRGLSACGFNNENIKEADIRYQLYLQNLSKIQSYTQTYKNQRKSEVHKPSKNVHLDDNKKKMDKDRESFNMDYELLESEGDPRPCNRVCQKNRKERLENSGEKSKKHEASNKSQERGFDPSDIKKKLQETLSMEIRKLDTNNQEKDSHETSPNRTKIEIKDSKHDKTSENNSKANTKSPSKEENTNSKVENIVPISTLTVQHVNIKNDNVPKKAMIQQTYLFKNQLEKKNTIFDCSQKIKQIDESTNHGHKTLQNKLNKLKSMETDGAKSLAKGLSGTDESSNIYVNLANSLHKKANFIKK